MGRRTDSVRVNAMRKEIYGERPLDLLGLVSGFKVRIEGYRILVNSPCSRCLGSRDGSKRVPGKDL